MSGGFFFRPSLGVRYMNHRDGYKKINNFSEIIRVAYYHESRTVARKNFNLQNFDRPTKIDRDFRWLTSSWANFDFRIHLVTSK